MVVRNANNWIPTTTVKEMVQQEYDVLIAGLVPGGGAILFCLFELWNNQGAYKFGILERGTNAVSFPLIQYPNQNIDTARDLILPENSTLEGQHLPEFSGATMVYALGQLSLFWNAFTPLPIESELRECQSIVGS